jgi:penicillin-binding protein activator
MALVLTYPINNLKNNIMLRKIFTLTLLALTIVFTACNQRKIQRIDPSEQVDLSGRWNDYDARLVAQEMTSDALTRPWRNTHIEKNGGNTPVIIIGLVHNKTHEHIETENFIKNMEREFINTGLVRVVQGGEFRQQLRDERADQQQFASQETMKKWGREIGADYIVTGVMTSVQDAYRKEKVVQYQINLELTSLETNEKVWIGEKQIKKAIRN